MKRFAIACALALSLSLLAGCMPGVVITSPKDEEFQREFQESWSESLEELEEDWRDALDEFQDTWDTWNDSQSPAGEKDHFWKISDVSDEEAAILEIGTVTDPEQVQAIDSLLNDDGRWGARLTEDPGAPAYSYIYCQQETLKAGQDPEDLDCEELVRFTVSAEKDVVTMVILKDLPSLLNVDLGDFLTFCISVPAETAEALRSPARFLDP